MCKPVPSARTARVNPSRLRRIATISLLIAAGVFLTGVSANGAVRTWTDNLNRTWQGEFLRVDGPSAVFRVSGKEYPFPLANLSTADKLLIFKLRQAAPAGAATPAPAPAASPAVDTVAAPAGTGRTWTYGSVPVEPGATVETDLPLPAEFVSAVAKAYGEAAPTPDHVRASLAVPADFDGGKPQKVLIGIATASGDVLSIPTTRDNYTKDGLAHGYVVLAVDGGYGKPKYNDATDYRLILLKVALAELNARFPQAKKEWTFATAGFSGGCGYAGHQALWLSTQGYRVTGIMMLNCNYPPTMWEHDPDMRGNTSRWHQIPAFFSFGTNDTVATPPMVKEAIDTTKRGGYQRVRVEEHPGNHQVWDAHVNVALEWFDALAGGAKH